MKRILLMALIAVLPVAAQEQKKVESTVATNEPQNPLVQKLFILKYAEPRAVEPLIRVLTPQINTNSEMHAITVVAPRTTMQAIEDAIARLDTPAAAPKNIDLTCYFIIGGDTENAGTLPKDLDNVVTQLKATFPFKTYRLMDVLTMRARTGQRVDTSSSGGAAGFLGNPNRTVLTTFHINSASVAQDGTTIRIDGLKTNSRVPVAMGSQGQFEYRDLGINTDLDMKEGQKVVVGRIGITSDQALFLVLMAKIVN